MNLFILLLIAILVTCSNLVAQSFLFLPESIKSYCWFGHGAICILLICIASFHNPDGTSARVSYDKRRNHR